MTSLFSLCLFEIPILNSKITLLDGRPAWKAMDTCAYNQENPCVAAYDLLSGKQVSQRTIKSEYWWLKTDGRESPVAEHFGLSELRRRARKVVAAKQKARRRLAMAGVSRKVKGPISFRVVKRKFPLMAKTIPSSGIHSQDSVYYLA